MTKIVLIISVVFLWYLIGYKMGHRDGYRDCLEHITDLVIEEQRKRKEQNESKELY